jgi:hypothetical protein
MPPESHEVALSYARALLGEVLIQKLTEHAIQGSLTSLYRFIQRLLALARACWRSLALLARMAAARWFVKVRSSSAACLGSSCSKRRYLRSILPLADSIALRFLYRGRFPSVPPRLDQRSHSTPVRARSMCARARRERPKPA